jgi:hypothetical protein
MRPNPESRLALVWLALLTVTLISWWIGSRHGHAQFASNSAITYSVILIAGVKVRVIIREFMEVRHAPVLLRRLTDGWILFVILAVLGIYSFGLSIPPTV